MERMTVEQAREVGFQFSGHQRKSKYGNKKTDYSGRQYDSKKEAERAAELDILQRSGVVRNWQAQPKFHFEHNGQKICTYIADFRVEYPDGKVEIEDVKGVRTGVYMIKKKMMKAFYGIEIKEI